MRELKAGTVWINDPLTDNDAGPFGGFKQSGLGRELGQEGLEAFQETKHVHMERRSRPRSGGTRTGAVLRARAVGVVVAGPVSDFGFRAWLRDSAGTTPGRSARYACARKRKIVATRGSNVTALD
jgi:hypothetical protein